jgi:TMEM175 potassium channel family protein
MQDPGTARMEAFSDGVFAIAATLLVLELNADTSNGTTLGHALLHLWPGYLAYATSFLTIGIIWVNHHQCVQCLDRVDRTMLFVNTLFLMVIAFIPFPTRLVAEHLQGPGEHAAVYAYAITLLAMAITFDGWWRYARHRRRLIAAAVPQSRVNAISRAFDPGVPLYLLVLGVAVVSPLASVGLTLALAAFYIPSSALFERKQAA